MKLRRITSLVLSVSMLLALAACSKDAPVETTTIATTTTEATTEETTEATTEATTTEAEIIEVVVPDELYDPSNPLAVNPISGLQNMNPDNQGYRSIAIVINNKYEALPQKGVSTADAIYEYETEGGQTRLLVVYADVNTIPAVGSLRSARILSTDLAAGNNSIFIHYGRNDRVPAHISEWNIDHIDGNNCSAGSKDNPALGDLPTGLFFWRDYNWLKVECRALEHTAVSNGEFINAAIDHFDIKRTGEQPFLYNFVADNSTDIANGEPCTSLNVYFSANNDDALFTYDEETGLYYKSQYNGKPQMDMNNDQQIAVTNVVVCFAEIRSHGDITIDAYLEEGGTGYYASMGKIIPITWTKPTPTEQIKIFNADGEEVQVNRGVSYTCIVDNDYTAKTTYEGSTDNASVEE